MIYPVNFPKAYKKILPQLVDAFEDFILRGEYIGGSQVAEFEKKIAEYLKVEHVVACKSGTHAIQLALIAAGIGKGDEVITVGNTYYATAYAVMAVGATPVFCEIDDDGLMDPEAAEQKITAKTKALLPVHLYGLPAQKSRLDAICKRNNLVLIEDCAHAFGTEIDGRSISADSDFACYSFYPTKNLGAFGDAGMVITKSEKHAERLREILYLTDETRTKFDPRAIHAMLDPLQARLMSVVLDVFDEAKEYRKQLASIYRSKLSAHVKVMPDVTGVTPHMFTLHVPDRNKFKEHMENKGIHLQIHYPIDLHRLPQFGGLGEGSLPFTEKHNKEVISLSVHPSVSVEDAETICEEAVKYFKSQS